MATYTSNYAWTKPGGNDQVDISVLNGNLDSQDAIMHKAFTNMAQAFSQLSTYAVGDIVLYDNELYKCHTAVTVAGAWTGSTNWTSWTLAEGGGGGGTSNYNDLTNKPSINGVTLSGNKTTSDFGISYNDLTNKPSLATVATSGSYADLSSKPENANTFQGTIAEWNQLSTAEKKAYDHASIPDSIDGGVTFPANKVVLTGGGNVEDAVNDVAPRTATGTTLAQLADAIRQLTNKQKMLCTIEVLCSAQSSYTQVLRRRGGRNNSADEIFNICELNIGSSPIKSIEYRLSIDSQNSSYQYFAVRTDGTSQADNWTITSWTLYYQGTPIS